MRSMAMPAINCGIAIARLKISSEKQRNPHTGEDWNHSPGLRVMSNSPVARPTR